MSDAGMSDAGLMAVEEEVMTNTMTIAIIVGNLKPAVKDPKLQFLPEHHRTRETLQAVAMAVTEAMVGMAVTAAMTIESAETLQGHSTPYVVQEKPPMMLSGHAL